MIASGKNHVLAAARNRPAIIDRVINHGLSISTSFIRVFQISAISPAFRCHIRGTLMLLCGLNREAPE